MTDPSLPEVAPPLMPALKPAAHPHLRFRGARAITALILREMSTTYGRSPGGYLWAVLQPVAMIVMLTLAFSVLLRSPSLGTSFLLFYASGFLIMRMFQEVVSAVGWAIGFNQALLAYPRVTYVDTLVARGVLALLTQIMVSAIVLVGIFLYDDVRVILDFAPILLAYGMAILLGFGIGTFNAYASFSFPVYKTVWGILTRPLMLVSGIFYIYEDLPEFAQTVLWYNPLIHLTGLARMGFYADYDPGYISLLYVALVACIPMFFGVLMLRRYSKDILYK
ncbi:ABC transporter permease [Tritonibacter multivorans]|nr:ABC transporter permease [Tritonibacter multivorans]MDA7422715.1 ABC transporter permease [Tritonibacter multivorans]